MDYAMTHAEISREMGISRARVQQLERSAMKKLAEALKERGITGDAVQDQLDSKALEAEMKW